MQISRRRVLAAGGGMVLATRTALRPVRAQAKPVTIAIQYGTSHLSTTIAEKLKLFEKHAHALGAPERQFIVKRLSGSPAMNDALFSGSADIGAYGITALLLAWAKTRTQYDIRGIAACNHGVLALYTNDASIKSIADIRTTDRIAVVAPTAPQAVLLRMAAEKAFGAGQSSRFDRQMVSLPHPDATTALLSGGSISLYFAAPPFTNALEATPNIRKVMDAQDIIGRPFSGALLGSTAKFADENPLIVRAIVDGLREANYFIRAEPRKAAEFYLDIEKSRVAVEEVEKAIKGQRFVVEPSGIVAFAEFLARTTDMKPAPVKWQDVFFAPISEGEGS